MEPTMQQDLLKKQAEAEELAVERAIEEKRVELAISLNICPVCGAKIINQKYEKYNPPKKYFWGIIKIKGYRWDYRKICSVDKAHYENKRNYSNGTLY